ncbi:hypothetical protein QBC32DRAFT_269883 [Pseudoneurospora amorphoporcata]|uniref:Uncharacterized protein n=1 Tax=Pseudoneurospora amorphoporcata TaxID=241081 RepID=A0AAN6NN49_9PEZI|nr:hypothetical protein QBC32DRAFT_269883 [Pseudoneurospora amorphoporcata]
MILYLPDVLPSNSLRWKYSHNGAHYLITSRARRDTAIFAALCALVGTDLPSARLNSPPAKAQVERYLVEAVDAATRFVSETPAMLDYMDPFAGFGLTGVQDQGSFNPLAEEVSFLDRAKEANTLGSRLTPHVFKALFLAIIEARKRFLDFAAENLGPQDPASHSLLAQACDRFLAAAVFWDMTSFSVQLESETYDYEETVAMALEQQQRIEGEEDDDDEEEEEEEEKDSACNGGNGVCSRWTQVVMRNRHWQQSGTR